MLFVVDRVVETCSGCPSQWEGKTRDGYRVYARYRYGVLRVYIDGDVVFTYDSSDPYGGVMSYDELQRHTRHLISWPKSLTES